MPNIEKVSAFDASVNNIQTALSRWAELDVTVTICWSDETQRIVSGCRAAKRRSRSTASPASEMWHLTITPPPPAAVPAAECRRSTTLKLAR